MMRGAMSDGILGLSEVSEASVGVSEGISASADLSGSSSESSAAAGRRPTPPKGPADEAKVSDGDLGDIPPR